jgi:hypothetical protein
MEAGMWHRRISEKLAVEDLRLNLDYAQLILRVKMDNIVCLWEMTVGATAASKLSTAVHHGLCPHCLVSLSSLCGCQEVARYLIPVRICASGKFTVIFLSSHGLVYCLWIGFAIGFGFLLPRQSRMNPSKLVGDNDPSPKRPQYRTTGCRRILWTPIPLASGLTVFPSASTMGWWTNQMAGSGVHQGSLISWYARGPTLQHPTHASPGTRPQE